MPRRPLILTSVVAVAAFALLAAGCGGGGGSPGVANNASTTTTATGASAGPLPSALLAFSQCMRSNGVPGFPDPQRFAGGNVKLTIHGFGTSPAVQSALNACHQLLPSGPGQTLESAQQQRTKLAAELSFAKCMRSHGVARFPDPTAQGELPVEMVQAQGIDVHSPTFLHVVQACLPASHGWLTAAKVREAINNAGH
jgi:hypothetical protein